MPAGRKNMWILLLTVLGLISALGLYYLVRKVHRLSVFQKLGAQHSAVSWILSACTVSLLGFFLFVNAPTMIVIMLHLIIAFLLSDLIGWIIRRITKKTVCYDLRILTAVLIAAVYLGIGCVMAFHVFETHYTVSADKEISTDLRIVGFSDSHLGVTLDGKRFSQQMERIQELEPDLVVIAGDFVDGSSSKEDMLEACRALGNLKTSYGIYYISGNHDDDDYGNRSFSYAALTDALRENGVRILEDEYELIDDSVYLLGRKDRSDPYRQDMASLTAGMDANKYMIVIDHQPNDYEKEAEAGADLVFSGHTHGGHIFPMGPIGVWIGANDRAYGLETRGQTTFIVSSGISGWGIPIKTGTYSEFCVIDLRKAG